MMRIKRSASPALMCGRCGLGSNYTVSNGVLVGREYSDMAEFKGLQRALNQWVAKAGASELMLAAVDGKPGPHTYQSVRDGVILARQRGNTISIQEPVGLTDVGTHAMEYAETFASLAGVTLDISSECRRTDYRPPLASCKTVTDAPATSIYRPARSPEPIPVPVPGEGETPFDGESPKPKVASATGWLLAAGLVGTVIVVGLTGKKKRPKSAAPMMGLRRCMSCGGK